MEQLSLPTPPRASSASPSPTRRPQPTIRMQRTPSLQTLHTVNKNSKKMFTLCYVLSSSFVLFHHIKQIFSSKRKAIGRKHLIYMSLNFRFEVPFTTYLPQWTIRGFEVLPTFLPDTGSSDNAFQVVRVSHPCCPLGSYKSTLNNILFQPITASICIICVCVVANSHLLVLEGC